MEEREPILPCPEGEEEAPDTLITLPDGRELYEHFHFTADKGQKPLRIDKYLVTRMERTSRNRIQQAADAGCILVNGRPAKSSYQVKPADEISIVMDKAALRLRDSAREHTPRCGL